MFLHPCIVLVTISRQDGHDTERSTTNSPRSDNNCETAENRSPSSSSSALIIAFHLVLYLHCLLPCLSLGLKPLSPTVLISVSFPHTSSPAGPFLCSGDYQVLFMFLSSFSQYSKGNNKRATRTVRKGRAEQSPALVQIKKFSGIVFSLLTPVAHILHLQVCRPGYQDLGHSSCPSASIFCSHTSAVFKRTRCQFPNTF